MEAAREYENLIRRTYSIFESGDVSQLDQLFTRDVIEHTPDWNVAGVKTGMEYFREQMRMYTTAFPNGRFEVNEVFVKGNKAIAYVTYTGVNTGELFGMPPTNRKVTLDICEMFVITDMKISEHWSVVDNFAFMTQLDIISEKEIQARLVQHQEN